MKITLPKNWKPNQPLGFANWYTKKIKGIYPIDNDYKLLKHQ